MDRRIVYPDADGDMAALISGSRLARLEALGRFTVHHGRPRDEAEYLARIDGAAGLLLGWDLPASVMAAATPPLEIIAFCGIGVGSFVDLDAAQRLGVAVLVVRLSTEDPRAQTQRGRPAEVVEHDPADMDFDGRTRAHVAQNPFLLADQQPRSTVYAIHHHAADADSVETAIAHRSPPIPAEESPGTTLTHGAPMHSSAMART